MNAHSNLPATVEKIDRAPVSVGGEVRPLIPASFEAAWRFADMISSSGMAPRGMEKPAQLMAAILQGLEVGMTPMAAVQSIAVVNGRPAIYGDGAIALVRASGLCEFVEEEITGEGDKMLAICRAKRKGEKKPVEGRFSVEDAKKASLWSKSGPWTQYPKRMLQMRARGFALRDAFADVLKGMILREEAEDIPQTVTAFAAPDPNAHPVIEHQSQSSTADQRPAGKDEKAGGSSEVGDPPDPDAGEGVDMGAELARLESELEAATTEEAVGELYDGSDIEATLTGTDSGVTLARQVRDRHLERVRAAAKRKPAAQSMDDEEETAPADPKAAFRDRILAAARKVMAEGGHFVDVQNKVWKPCAVERTALGYTPSESNVLKAEVTAIANGQDNEAKG